MYAQEIGGNQNLNNSHRIFGKKKENVLGTVEGKDIQEGRNDNKLPFI